MREQIFKVVSQAEVMANYESQGVVIPPAIVVTPSFTYKGETYYVKEEVTDDITLPLVIKAFPIPAGYYKVGDCSEDVTALLVRMHDVQQVLGDKSMIKVIEWWREALSNVRNKLNSAQQSIHRELIGD